MKPGNQKNIVESQLDDLIQSAIENNISNISLKLEECLKD